MATEQALAGCILGMACGDALGLPCENLTPRRARKLFSDVDQYHFVFGRGMFSDDTEHACLTAQSLLVCGGDSKRFLNSLAWRLRWWFLGLPAGIGRATFKACVKLWLGVSPLRSGIKSAGNGPCMRSPILGIMFAADEARLREFTLLSTRLTHTDPRAEQGALIIALAAALAVQPGHLEHRTVIDRLLTFSNAGPEFRDVLEKVRTSLDNNEPTETYAATLNKGRGVSGYIVFTVAAVIHAWLRFPEDYASAVRVLVRCGGDTDTTAALVGGLVGARVGPETIPARWRNGLAEWPRNVPWLLKLSRELAGGIATPRKSVRVHPLGVFARNIMFLAIVLAHVVRRMLPPY